MSLFRDVALDAGYRGREADHVAMQLESDAMAEAAMEDAYHRELEREWARDQQREHDNWLWGQHVAWTITPAWAVTS